MRIIIAAPVILIVAAIIISLLIIPGILPVTDPGAGRFVKAVYGDAPRTTEGITDTDELMRQLEANGANTYSYLLRDPVAGFEELKTILPVAKENGIKVWVTIAPPSGLSPEVRNDMAYIDYIGWGRRFAQLSLEHDNLEAWNIDNVLIDHQFFTPGYLEEITGAAKGINPNLKFIPVIYYQNVQSAYFDDRSVYFDGVQFYFTYFPPGDTDLSEVLLPQLAELEGKFTKPVILGIYASPWSLDYPTSPAYVEQLLKIALQHTDGAMIYTIGQEGEKLAAIKRQFGG